VNPGAIHSDSSAPDISGKKSESTEGALQSLPLRVGDLKQWAYCPRIVFFGYVMPVDKKSTFKMRQGNEAEEAIDRLEKRRSSPNSVWPKGDGGFISGVQVRNLACPASLIYWSNPRKEFSPSILNSANSESTPTHRPAFGLRACS